MLHYTQITNLIAELLFKHDCVIVPNFGGFVARNQSSGFNKGNSILYPQSKHILFNKNLIHNDGLLVSALMNKNNIGFEDATNCITDYKDYIKSLLNVKKRFELNSIGLLFIDAENILRFEAKADINFLIDSFGFEPIVANCLTIEPEKQIVTKQFVDRQVSVETLKPQKKSYAKIATLAIGLPITLGFILFAAYSKPMQPLLQSNFNPFYTPQKTYIPHTQKINKAFFIDQVKTDNLLVDANGFANFKLYNEGDILVASANDSFNKTNQPITTKTIQFATNTKNSFSGKYQVVVGCFGIEKNANKLIKELKTENVNAGISGINNKGLHIVSCGGFDNKEDATNLLTSIKSNFPNAWVMSN